MNVITFQFNCCPGLPHSDEQVYLYILTMRGTFLQNAVLFFHLLSAVTHSTDRYVCALSPEQPSAGSAGTGNDKPQKCLHYLTLYTFLYIFSPLICDQQHICIQILQSALLETTIFNTNLSQSTKV